MKRVLIVLACVVVVGCTAMERSFYQCDGRGWYGWEYEKKCNRLNWERANG